VVYERADGSLHVQDRWTGERQNHGEDDQRGERMSDHAGG